MFELFLEDGDLLEEVNIQTAIQEGFFKRVREIINHNNWKKKAKANDFDALTENVTPYKRKLASKSQMNTFYRNNDFFIECVSGDEEFCQIVANLLGSKFKINTPVECYVISGKDMNKVYDLYGNNAYQHDVHHVVVPLNTLKNNNDIVAAKSRIKARYFNDVVDNNEYREYLAGRHEKSEQIQWIIDAYARQ